MGLLLFFNSNEKVSFMKNVVLAFFVSMACSPVFAGSCGSCGPAVASTVRTVVSAPVAVVRSVRSNVGRRVASRRYARNCQCVSSCPCN